MKKKLKFRDLFCLIADGMAKPIFGYENLYYVTVYGDIISTKNFKQGKIILLEQTINTSGYLQVGLYKDSRIKSHRIHRLVAQAFIPNPENKPQINHINEDKLDNRIENLEWCTSEYNINYGTRNVRSRETRIMNNLRKTNLDNTEK